jgi:pyruvate ferredoxin oxidoreductase alpha subunit
MAVRDAGWVQLFAETNQEATDLHIQAFRLAEELSVPVMVCMDGFILTHATERVDLPTQEQVDAYLPPFEPRQLLDPDEPVSIGAMVGPEAFEEVRFIAHTRQQQALVRIGDLAEEFAEAFGRDSGGLVHRYRSADAETVVVALGSVLGTIKDVVDSLRDRGVRIGVVGITSFRPFPIDALRIALEHARRVVVVEKAFSVGFGGVLSTDVAMSLTGLALPVATVVAGLGGRPITKASLQQLFETADRGELERLTFLDLRRDLIERELQRIAQSRTSGPSAENILRDLGTVASGIG